MRYIILCVSLVCIVIGTKAHTLNNNLAGLVLAIGGVILLMMLIHTYENLLDEKEIKK